VVLRIVGHRGKMVAYAAADRMLPVRWSTRRPFPAAFGPRGCTFSARAVYWKMTSLRRPVESLYTRGILR
jgi:hypothetical protein